WLSYRFMTEEMQHKFRALSENRNLWEGAKVATHQDLVALFIVRAAEKYLNTEGTFAYVTPLAVLSRQQYEGFRAGKWGYGQYGEITELWDLDKVRPTGFFPVPSGVVFGRKHTHDPSLGGEPPASGTPATKVVLEGLRDQNGWEATAAALSFTTVSNRTLTATADGGSPYRAYVTQGATITPRCLHFVVEEAVTSKLGQSAGRTNVRSLRTRQEKEPWKSLPDVTGVVENRFLFDVHLGSTIVPYRELTPWRAILPLDKDTLLDEDNIIDHASGLGQWWETTSKLWEENRTRQRSEEHTSELQSRF